VTSELSVDESVCTSGDSATTVTFSETAPTCILMSSRVRSPAASARFAVCDVNPCSSIVTL